MSVCRCKGSNKYEIVGVFFGNVISEVDEVVGYSDANVGLYFALVEGCPGLYADGEAGGDGLGADYLLLDLVYFDAVEVCMVAADVCSVVGVSICFGGDGEAYLCGVLCLRCGGGVLRGVFGGYFYFDVFCDDGVFGYGFYHGVGFCYCYGVCFVVVVGCVVWGCPYRNEDGCGKDDRGYDRGYDCGDILLFHVVCVV